MRPALSHFTYLYVLKVPGIRCSNLHELLLWIKKRPLTSFVALGMQSEGNAPKNGEPAARFSFTPMVQHTVQFWSRLCRRRTMWQHRSIPHTLLIRFQLIFICSLQWNQHWRDGAFVMRLTLRMRRTSWKGFHKMASSRNVSNTFTIAGGRVQLYKEMYVK